MTQNNEKKQKKTTKCKCKAVKKKPRQKKQKAEIEHRWKQTDGNKTVRTDSCSSPSISHEPAVSQYI